MKILVFVTFFLFISFEVNSQNTLEKIKKTRENTLKEIEYANKLLLETQGKTSQSLNEINIINHKLEKRKGYLTGLEVEMNVIKEAIDINKAEIENIENEIEKIKKVYELMVINLYKNKSQHYQSMYVFASENLNQFYKRISTVKLYNNYLRKQKIDYEKLKSELDERNSKLTDLYKSKDMLLNKTKNETYIIQKEVNEKKKIVKGLKQKVEEIENDIRNKEKNAKKLEAELIRIIEEERRKSKAKGNAEITTPAERIVSNDFEKNRGSLPWPIQKGIITGKYGEHKHPDYKDVTVRNDGVYISTSKGEKARAIFKGVVSKVFTISGNYAVIIKHGQYYSLYYNLINVIVKPGQEVGIKEIIGTVSTDNSNKETVLYFQIWKETERKDPELWLAPM